MAAKPSFEFLKRQYGCTVVSLLPWEIFEEKPHILPSSFRIPKAENGHLGILHVREGIYYIPNPLIDEGRPGSSFKQIEPPTEMARSICEDYIARQICCGEGATPGLFWVEQCLTEDEVREVYPEKVALAEEQQKNWFRNLVGMAEADWNKNHNAFAVSDLQRAAARSLNIKKDWVDFMPEDTITCPYCKATISPDSIKCFNCKEVVNAVAYKKLQKEIVGV